MPELDVGTGPELWAEEKTVWRRGGRAGAAHGGEDGMVSRGPGRSSARGGEDVRWCRGGQAGAARGGEDGGVKAGASGPRRPGRGATVRGGEDGGIEAAGPGQRTETNVGAGAEWRWWRTRWPGSNWHGGESWVGEIRSGRVEEEDGGVEAAGPEQRAARRRSMSGLGRSSVQRLNVGGRSSVAVAARAVAGVESVRRRELGLGRLGAAETEEEEG